MTAGFWSGKRVLVTGHTGFKGAWLSLWLQRLGADVVGYSRSLPTSPALFEAAGVAAGMSSLQGDLLDLERLRKVLGDVRPDVVVHMAAQPIVTTGFEDPVGTFATNVLGTAHLLEAVRAAQSVRVVISVTTDKVYANREWEWAYREDEPLGGIEPYAASKAGAELVTQAYRESFLAPAGVRVASVRSGNVIGGGDWARARLVPDLLRGALTGETVAVRSPNAVRPWQHVLNPLSGYLLLAERLWHEPEHAHGWNFGPDPHDDRPVGWVADRLAELWGEGMRWSTDETHALHEAHHLRLDSSLARARLGWAPRWDLEQALRSIVGFVRAQEAGDDLRTVVLNQIEAFEQGCAASAWRTSST